MTDTITQDIKSFVVTNFLYGQDDQSLTVEQSFLESGIVDSTGVLELVAFLEQQFNITVADRELLPENLDSVQNVATFVSRKLAAQGVQVAG
jgi:acyl carrier protein